MVADDDECSRPLVDELGQLRPCRAVEVVGGLVEQRDRGTTDAQSGDRDEHPLAAGHLGDPAAEVSGREPDLVQRFVGARLDVPVVADRVEVTLGDVAGLDRLHRIEDRLDAEQLGDRRVASQRERLRQVTDLVASVDVAGGRLQLARDKTEQGGLAGTVAADQPGSAGAEGAVDAVEGDGAVGPLEGQIAQGDCGFRRHCCASLSLPSTAGGRDGD